ncbi:MAG: hypothetical protein V2A76_12340, partial [Planctomycetota bacterium]
MRYLLLLALLVACSEARTPGQQMSLAREAVDRGDFAEALELCEGLLNWTGEGAVSEDERFQASLTAVHCLIELDRA